MYFEEFEIGQKFNLEPVIMTLEDIDEFAKKYDPLPIHINPEFAENGVFNGIIASGFHTLCAIWGQWVRLNKTGAEVVGGIAIDYLNWTAPVRPNDTLQGVVEIVDLIRTSKGGRGILVTKVTVHNQDNILVMTTQVKGLLKTKDN